MCRSAQLNLECPMFWQAYVTSWRASRHVCFMPMYVWAVLMYMHVVPPVWYIRRCIIQCTCTVQVHELCAKGMKRGQIEMTSRGGIRNFKGYFAIVSSLF